MANDEFGKLLENFNDFADKIVKKGITLADKVDFTNFKSTENRYIVDGYKRGLKKLRELIDSAEVPGRVNELLKQLSFEDVRENRKIAEELIKYKEVNIKSKSGKISINKIPAEIKEEVRADLDEMKRCFESKCYRSCIILCGRVIEVCLHAKYFKKTGFDILEKNPGIGLGKLIAKMQEKGIRLDPGLTQQIHLVNNVRIFSVHKKQRTFYPSKEQTEAVILYTIDIVNHLF
jgi:hypothetical protein